MRETSEVLTHVTHVNGWDSRLHELHESKPPFVSRIEFIRSKLKNFSAHVSGDIAAAADKPRLRPKEPRAGPSSDDQRTRDRIAAAVTREPEN